MASCHLVADAVAAPPSTAIATNPETARADAIPFFIRRIPLIKHTPSSSTEQANTGSFAVVFDSRADGARRVVRDRAREFERPAQRRRTRRRATLRDPGLPPELRPMDWPWAELVGLDEVNARYWPPSIAYARSAFAQVS
jgi:hypothetical protein